MDSADNPPTGGLDVVVAVWALALYPVEIRAGPRDDAAVPAAREEPATDQR